MKLKKKINLNKKKKTFQNKIKKFERKYKNVNGSLTRYF
jgi:hypothetical protein